MVKDTPTETLKLFIHRAFEEEILTFNEERQIINALEENQSLKEHLEAEIKGHSYIATVHFNLEKRIEDRIKTLETEKSQLTHKLASYPTESKKQHFYDELYRITKLIQELQQLRKGDKK